MMKIAVVGTGYVGLVSGTCFAESGHVVTCIDNNKAKVNSLNNGQITIYEPGLETLFERNREQGRLTFTTSLKEGIQGAQVIFLALPTPPGEDGAADLKYVLGVAKDLSELITEYTVIVNKSTVPVGTAEKVEKVLLNKLSSNLFDVVSNPEFLREGVAVDDFMKPDRIVIGSNSNKASEIMQELYEPFVRQGNPVLVMDRRSSEMTKYAANSYLAARISFMNEMANLCDQVGANVDMVRKGIGSDQRIGKRFLFSGIGYGGSCFPKDVQALDQTAKEHKYDFKILKAVMDVNDRQKSILFNMISDHFNGEIAGKKMAIWGLAFKPNTDDIREAPALVIIDLLLEHGAQVTVYDPEAMENVKALYGDRLVYNASHYEALQDADALAICTEWSVFRSPDFDQVKDGLSQPIIFDGRNVYDIQKMDELGFVYKSIGRNKSDS